MDANAPTAPDLHTAYADARRRYRSAWRAYQEAHGADFLPAMDAWIDANREVMRLEAIFDATHGVAA